MPSKQDAFLEEWLKEFKSDSTRRVYRAGLTKFKEAIGIEDLKKYVNNSPDVASDIRKMLAAFSEGKPSKTISTYVGAVKVFLQDKGVKVKDESWSKIRRRGYMPKRVRPQTLDKKPTKLQLKRILNYVDVKGKALILFLVSSGARIGETLQLKQEDFDLTADPPKAHIKAEYTKGGVGERTVYFSKEAKEAITDWLAIRETINKKDGTTYDRDAVFPFSKNNAQDIWNRACDKADLGQKDKRTGRRIYHLHSLRKFFRTKIGLDLDITHTLMGHAEYLDESYLRHDQSEIAQVYKEAMSNVSIYEWENEELKQRAKNIEEENNKLRQQLMQIEARMAQTEKILIKILDNEVKS